MPRWFRRNRFARNPYFPRRRAWSFPKFLKRILWITTPLGIIVGLYVSPWFRLSRVEIRGAELISVETLSSYVLAEIPDWQRQPFWGGEHALADSLKQQFPILSAGIYSRFPNHLRIDIVEKKPTAFWQAGDHQLILDQTGAIMRSKTSDDNTLNLPYFSVEMNTNPENANPLEATKLEQALWALQEMSQNQIVIVAMIFPTETNDWLKFQTNETWEIYLKLGAHEEMQTQIKKLTAILSSAGFDRSRVRYIDVRFGDHVYYQ